MSYDYPENILVQKSADNLLRDELGCPVCLSCKVKNRSGFTTVGC